MKLLLATLTLLAATTIPATAQATGGGLFQRQAIIQRQRVMVRQPIQRQRIVIRQPIQRQRVVVRQQFAIAAPVFVHPQPIYTQPLLVPRQQIIIVQ